MAALSERPPLRPRLTLELASRAVSQEPRVAWFAHAKGLAALRAGDVKTAAAALLLSQQLAWEQGHYLNEIALGLTDVRDGRVELARARLDQAIKALDLPPSLQFAGGKVLLLDWLEFQILRKQLESPLFDRAFPVDPFAH
jgi:hypothetical protein